MIAVPTGKKVKFWNGVQFVEQDEVVHFNSQTQADAAFPPKAPDATQTPSS